MCSTPVSPDEQKWDRKTVIASVFLFVVLIVFLFCYLECLVITTAFIRDLHSTPYLECIATNILKNQFMHKAFMLLNKLFEGEFLLSSGVEVLQTAILLLPAALAMLFLTLGCRYFSHPWRNGKIHKQAFRTVECLMRFFRVYSYVNCLSYLILTLKSDSFRDSPTFMAAAALSSILLFECNLQSLMRLNFRRWPNYVIAVANTILYLALLDLFCSHNGSENAPFMGFIPLFNSVSRTDVIDAIREIPDGFRNSVIAAAVLAMLKDSLSNIIVGGVDTYPADLAQRRRRNRRRLLTHWHYDKDGTFSSWENSVFILLIFEGLAFFTAFVAAFFLPTVIKAVQAFASQTGRSNVMDSTIRITAATVQNAEIGNLLPFATYLIMVAAIMCVPALLSFWSISDERLVQSEYLYLSYQGSRLRPIDIKNSSSRWRDYCQVLVNLYSNVSGLDSEDQAYHSLKGMLIRIRNSLGTADTCTNTKFFSDILSAKGDINATLRRESSHNKSVPSKNDTTQQAQDIQFASELLALVDKHLNDSIVIEQDNILATQNPLYLVEHMSELFFQNQQHAWGQRFGAYNIDAEEGIRLLKMDSMIHILQRESYGHCGLRWLGCNCAPKPQQCSHNDIQDSETVLCNRLELLLIFPFIVIDCYNKRWNKVDGFQFVHDISTYYWNLFDEKIFIDKSETIEKVIVNVLRYFAVSETDTTVLRTIAPGFRGDKFHNFRPNYNKLSDNEKKIQQNRLYKANLLRKRDFESIDAPFHHLLRFSKLTVEPAEDLYRIAYSLFLYAEKGGNTL